LFSALIPLNQAAARRGLARLFRETGRAAATAPPGRVAPPPAASPATPTPPSGGLVASSFDPEPLDIEVSVGSIPPPPHLESRGDDVLDIEVHVSDSIPAPPSPSAGFERTVASSAATDDETFEIELLADDEPLAFVDEGAAPELTPAGAEALAVEGVGAPERAHAAPEEPQCAGEVVVAGPPERAHAAPEEPQCAGEVVVADPLEQASAAESAVADASVAAPAAEEHVGADAGEQPGASAAEPAVAMRELRPESSTVALPVQLELFASIDRAGADAPASPRQSSEPETVVAIETQTEAVAIEPLAAEAVGAEPEVIEPFASEPVEVEVDERRVDSDRPTTPVPSSRRARAVSQSLSLAPNLASAEEPALTPLPEPPSGRPPMGRCSDVSELLSGFLAHTDSDDRMSEDLRRLVGLRGAVRPLSGGAPGSASR
jgi:hypothetical protein